MAKVSVIIPNYNRATIVADTINNMLAQSLPPMEVIVVDDGSTDGSVELIRERFGSRVTLICQENKGPGAARNAGINIASGDFIQFMDSDDLASLNKLEAQVNTLIETGADMVYGPWVKGWLKEEFFAPENIVLQQNPLPSAKTPLHWFLTNWSFVFQQCLLKRELVQKTGLFKENMRVLEDGDYFVRICAADPVIVHENKSLVVYRLNDFGKITTNEGAGKRAAEDRILFYTQVLEQIGIGVLQNDILYNRTFRLNIRKSIADARMYGLHFDQTLYAPLLEGNNVLYKLQDTFKEKMAGIRQRLLGHRWPLSYRAAKLTVHQIRLLEEMGLKLK